MSKTIKYRIKIITFKNGRKLYYAQIKRFLWKGIFHDGTFSIAYNGECSTRDEAMARIDSNYDGSSDILNIEFEHITRTTY